MTAESLRFILIPILVIVVMFIAKYIRKKLARPDYTGNVQRPGTFDRFISKLITGIAILFALLSILGLVTGESEMALITGIIVVFFLIPIFILRNAYDMSYQENEEYFVLRKKKNEVKIYYEDIIDWQPSFNEIELLAESKIDDKYIKVNIAIFKPEILLTRIIQMTAKGKFPNLDQAIIDDPLRETELYHFLKDYNYDYLIKDFREQQ